MEPPLDLRLARVDVDAEPGGVTATQHRHDTVSYPHLAERVLAADGSRARTWTSRLPSWHGMRSDCSAHTLTIAAADSQRSGLSGICKGTFALTTSGYPGRSTRYHTALHASRDKPKAAAAAGSGRDQGPWCSGPAPAMVTAGS